MGHSDILAIAFDAHERLNRIRRLIVVEIRTRDGKDLPELLKAERMLTEQFRQAASLVTGAAA
jgi:hypothetical protein